MAILNYLTITASSTPISQSSQNQKPQPTKVLLPKKKPEKLSTGVAPGEYGGPPVTTKLGKFWAADEDPLTSDDFIWNRDFMVRMKSLIRKDNDDDDHAARLLSSSSKEEPSGFLSLNRVMNLERLDVDMSKELTEPAKPALEHQDVEFVSKSNGRTSPKWRPAPTSREQKKWGRATKAATGGSEVMFRELQRPKEDPEVLAARSREQYLKLKMKMQLLTLGVGGVGLVSAYLSYSPEIATSYGVGFLGSLIYVRMLGSSVDSLASGATGVLKGAASQPRILIPVVLVMFYNRWNAIVVPEYGFMHLELIPMLVGFFTYKIATFIQAVEDAVSLVGGKTQT